MIHRVLLLLTMLVSLFTVDVVMAENNTVASGSLDGDFSSWGSSSLQGDWKIIDQNGKKFIELQENFKAKKGPDVKVFLSPLAAAELTGDNAAQNSVFVTLITVFEGKARIAIPEGTDLSRFQSLVFHCEEYSKLWGSSALSIER